MPGDFTAKKITQGMITNLRSFDSIQFSINPHTVSEKGGATISEDANPGFSSPLLRYASGKTKTISFELEIDGEISLRKKGTQIVNGLFPGREVATVGNATYDISAEIEFYQSLTYPTDPDLPGADGGLDRVALTIGTHINGVVCFVEEANPSIIEFDPDLAPTKAKMAMVLKVIENNSRYASFVWAPYVTRTSNAFRGG
jgi:hypothetical protein